MRHIPTIAALIAAAISLFAAAHAHAGDTPYYRTTPPGAMSPSTPGSGWTNGSSPFSVTLAPGASLWIALENQVDNNEKKIVTLKVNQVVGFPGHPTSTRYLKPKEFVAVGGTQPPNHAPHASKNANEFLANPPYRDLRLVFDPCPEWEYIRFENIDSNPGMFRLNAAATSACGKPDRAPVPPEALPSDTLDVLSMTLGVPGQTVNPQRITEIVIIPELVEMDLASAAPIAVNPGTGNWTPAPTFITPFGDPRPQGGFHWTSDGFGITPLDPFDLSVSMHGIADARYELFAFDADLGEWQTYMIDLLGVPWWETCDLYSINNTDTAIGQGGWEGWDDDPAFDAPITNAQPHSPPNSIEIKDNADLVREFEGADSGFWTFECWQYIPSDFASGGAGTFAGSYFNILNTYNGTDPATLWSVQMQFDSNDGLLKVFHGDGLNTVPVPFDTDRWVKIQADVDLENDWTEIYYDDELVTEYAWTGGVLGDGGGALDIAAVDLYAQGSTSIFYDDLVLVPVLTHCPADLAPPYGTLNIDDIDAFVTGFIAGDLDTADCDGNGSLNIDDIDCFVAAFLDGCP